MPLSPVSGNETNMGTINMSQTNKTDHEDRGANAKLVQRMMVGQHWGARNTNNRNVDGTGKRRTA